MITKEKLEYHRAHLIEKHEILHKRIEVAEIEKVRDDLLHEMKREKLALKDEINLVTKQIEEMSNEA